MSPDLYQKLKGVQTLNPEEQPTVDMMQVLKASRKSSRSQPPTRGSSEGTGVSSGVPNESTVILTTLSEGTGTKPWVLDEEKVTFEAKADVILDWGLEKESEYSEEESVDDEIDWETDDEIERGDEYVQENMDEEMKDAEVDDIGNGDEEITNTAKEDAEKTEEVKDDIKKAKLPPSSSSLSVSLGFGNQFLILSSNKSTVGTLKDFADAELNSLLDVQIQLEIPQIQVFFLEKDVQDLKAVGHTTILLTSLRSKIPSAVNAYLGSSLGDTLQKNPEKILGKRYHDDDDKDEDPFARPNLQRVKVIQIVRRPGTIVKPGIELEYNIEECYKALTDQVYLNNPKGDHCPYELSKPLPLKGHTGHLTVPSKYFFNKDLEYLKASNPKKKYSMSITKTKAARYELVGIKDVIPNLWRVTKKILSMVSIKINKLLGYGHLEEIAVRRANRQKYKYKEGDFVNLHLNDIEDMLLLVTQRKLFNLEGSDIVDLAMDFLGISTKELCTPSFDPPGAVNEYLNKQKRVMRADELYKFSDETLKLVHDELHQRVLKFRFGYNKEMSMRTWSTIDKKRSELMVKLIDKQSYETLSKRSFGILPDHRYVPVLAPSQSALFPTSHFSPFIIPKDFYTNLVDILGLPPDDIQALLGCPQVVSAAKLPILNPNEFDLWKMRIEQYFLMTDYSLWEVILNGDSPEPTRLIEEKHQLKFNSHKDAKSLMEAIEKRFGGNTKTKKAAKAC
uniref:Ribonuclease H-like domain-containing protein n=1 Tax=Tanacetum cinerariifolium TaxID=118510 RepID=A0A6L2J7U3_TANCI|nr:ribonuclease H-like domain-containing protein [Tanacetum cinerariifolium]